MLSSDEIKKIFKLSRLAYSDDDLEVAKVQINNILECIETVRKTEVGNTEPMSHVHGSFNIFREDKVIPLLTTEEALSNAPDRSGNFIKVPLIIETE